MPDQNTFPSLYPTGMPPSPPDTDVSDEEDLTESNKSAQKGSETETQQTNEIKTMIEGASSSVAASEPGLISESILTTSPSVKESNASVEEERASVGSGAGGRGPMQDILRELDKDGVTLPTSTARWKGLSGSSVVSSVTAGTQSENFKSCVAAPGNNFTADNSFLPSEGSSTSSSIVEKSFEDSSTTSSNAVDDTWTDGELPESLIRNIVVGEIVSNSQTFRTSNKTGNVSSQRPQTALSVLAPADGGGFLGNNNLQQQLQPQNALSMTGDNQFQQHPRTGILMQQAQGHTVMPQEVQVTQPMSAASQAANPVPAMHGMLPYNQSPLLVAAPPATMPLLPQPSQQAAVVSFQQQMPHSALSRASSAITEKSAATSGRRAITLRLLEDVVASAVYASKHGSRDGKKRFFFRRRTLSNPEAVSDEPGIGRSLSSGSLHNCMQSDRGTITVSWYEGTTTTELQDHVRNSVRRKLKLNVGGPKQLKDIRLIDESVTPNEEVVLSPYIPDGSHFLLKFTIKDNATAEPESNERFNRQYSQMSSFHSRAPDSPSAAPSPNPSSADLVSLQQLQILGAALLQNSKNTSVSHKSARTIPSLPSLSDAPEHDTPQHSRQSGPKSETERIEATVDDDNYDDDNHGVDESDPDTLVEERLKQLNELLLLQRIHTKRSKGHKNGKPSRRTQRRRREEKKQVIFILANYFVLFLSLIAISAEIHERAPRWMKWVEAQMDHVQDCAADRDALFECVSNGDIAGLYASFLFWITRSVTTKRLLLFGFDSPKKLWTVVYEALVTAVCWGTSYLCIRRGMNPDTRDGFLHKYWKDAVYGSLAGFNAAFLKAVLKNLIPQEVIEDALDSRQLKIVNWLQQVF